MSAGLRAGVLGGLLVAAIAGWWWWNSPERQIRRMLSDVAAGFSHRGEASGLDRLAAVAGLRHYFSEDVTIEPGPPFDPLVGREAVLAAAARLRGVGRAADVTFSDVQIAMRGDGRSATVAAVVTLRVENAAGATSEDGREIVLEVEPRNGRWVITDATAVTVLERISAVRPARAVAAHEDNAGR